MLSIAKFIKKKLELRENLVGTGFLSAPQAARKAASRIARDAENRQMQELDHRVTVIGEIASATGFAAQSTYIMFQVLLPEQGTWVFEDISVRELGDYFSRTEYSEFNKRKCVTQVSCGRIDNAYDVEDEDTTKFTSHFAFPFDYQFLAKESCTETERPHIIFQVNSTDEWNRQRIEGYGYIRIPATPGYHQMTV